MASVVNWSDLDGLAADALKAFEEDSVGWRRLWAQALYALTLDRGHEHEVKSAPRSYAMDSLLRMTADAFHDAEIGARNPLFQSEDIFNRPVMNAIDRTKRRAVATAGGAFLELGKIEGVRVLDSYRQAARTIRRFGGKIDWRQVRAAWVNRARYSDQERYFIDAAVRPFRERAVDLGLSELADAFAKEAAGILNSKVSVF